MKSQIAQRSLFFPYRNPEQMRAKDTIRTFFVAKVYYEYCKYTGNESTFKGSVLWCFQNQCDEVNGATNKEELIGKVA